MHDSSSESDSISLVVTNRNLDTQQSQYFDALDTIEENEEESTDDDLSDLDVSFFMTPCLFFPTALKKDLKFLTIFQRFFLQKS